MPPELIVVDATVPILFLAVDRMDLMHNVSPDIVATEEVIGEAEKGRDIKPKTRIQANRLDDARKLGVLRVHQAPKSPVVPGLSDHNLSLGAGERTTALYALSLNAVAVIDDNRARNIIADLANDLVMIRTRDLVALMITEKLLSTKEADDIKADWEANHKFRLTFESFANYPWSLG